MAIKALASRGATNSEIARLLGVTEGAVRYQVKRFERGQADGRARQGFSRCPLRRHRPVADQLGGRPDQPGSPACLVVWRVRLYR
ncbi:helix-turn-helix domain-containing protein [Microvirga sp. M2]|uniref:helix-turn-helix domain-containing protein n=1 Tax=Microvirga sp. M2 TaxID=3073270 RepID=UPI0039C2196F